MKIEIEISDQAYQAITERTNDVSAFVEAAALKDANGHEKKQRFDPEKVLQRLKELQGSFGDATLEEVLADRRCGIE